MFAPHCRRCGTRVLLGTEHVTSIGQHDEGLVVSFRCYCGTAGTYRPRPARGDR